MYEPKMKETDNSVIEFIESVENEKKKADAYLLLEIFEEVTGMPRENRLMVFFSLQQS